MLQARLLHHRDEIVPLLDRLEPLLAHCPWRQPFFRGEWVRAWLETFGRTRRPAVLVVTEDERLRGFWPFFEHRGILRRGLWPMLGEVADFFDPLYDGHPDTLQALVDALEATLDEYAFVWLPLVRSEFFREEIAWQPGDNARSRVIRIREQNPFLLVEGSFADWFESHTSPKARKTLRWQRRQLEEKGAVAFHRWAQPEDLRDGLRICAGIERKSWKGQQRRGIFSDPQFRAFYQKLLPELAAARRLEVSALSVDGYYIAYEVGLREAGGWYGMHNIAFLPEYAPYSPGKHLLLHTIEEAFASDTKRYDFLQGDFEYKKRYATHETTLHDVSLFAPGLAGKIVRSLTLRQRGRAGGLTPPQR